MTRDPDPHTEVEKPAVPELTEAARAQMEQFRTSHQTQVLTILLSDVVGSTRQQTELGNERAAELIREHRRIFRAELEGVEGSEIETAGDSFLVVFAAPSEGVKFALRMQAAMRRGRETEPELPQVRVGLHQGQVVVERYETGPKAMDVYGLQISVTARISDLGGGGQVLLSRAVFDDARAILRGDDLAGLGPVAWCNHGPYRFKGVEDSHEVCEVGEEGVAPLKAPPAGAKSWPADQSDEELGWRPASGVTVPGTSWVLQERLGKEESKSGTKRAFRGEFGEVWKAWNRSDKSHQVFKFCFRRDQLSALKREARLLKRLRDHRHPNLVEVFDVTEGDCPPYYLEMEYVEGPSLDEWLAGEPPLRERLDVIAQVADALDTVHAAGIYHRDIKPSNILLTRRVDGQLLAKLADFGLGAAEDPELLHSLYVSRQEGVAGTWDYIPPELREGENASPQSDIYSLGLTLYQVGAGSLNLQAGPGWEGRIESRILREDIARCMAQEPKQRWARAGDLAKALRSHDERLELIRLEREREERRRRAQRLARVAMAGVFLLAMIAAGFIYWLRMPGEVQFAIKPPGAKVEIDGRTIEVDQTTVPLRLAPGGYTVRISAEDHTSETREVLVERGRTKDFAVALRHHRGMFDATCFPVGSEIEVDGVAYGSRVRNLELDTGVHHLSAWSDGCFEEQRTITIAEGEHSRIRFWLDRGLGWSYRKPTTQGGAFLVGDADGDGAPDIMQNDISAMEILSSASGRLIGSLPAPVNNQRGLRRMDLGGEVGEVIVGGWERTTAATGAEGMDVWVIRTAEPKATFWRWPEGSRDWSNGGGVWAAATADLTGDGVREVVAPSNDGSAYLLEGTKGSLIRKVALMDKRPEYPPQIESFGEGKVAFLARFPSTAEEAGEKLFRFATGCASLKDGKREWEKDLGEAHGAIMRDLDGDRVPDIMTWRGAGWNVLDGATGKAKWSGQVSGTRKMLPYPWFCDVDGDGMMELLLRLPDSANRLVTLRLTDGQVVWEGPEGVQSGQHFDEKALFKRAPGGEILVMMEQSLAAIDPANGRIAWQIDGRPVGFLVGDWEGDGKGEIFAVIQGRGLVCADGAGRQRWLVRLNLDVRPYMLLPDGDGDGLNEVLIHRHAALYGVVRGPRVLWKQRATGPLMATPQVVDGAGDGRLQVVQLGAWEGEQALRCFDARTGALLWGTSCRAPVNRTWPIVDWDGDGKPDVAGVGWWPEKKGLELLAFRVIDGEKVCSTKVWDDGDYYSAPGSGDLDGDGRPDLVVARWVHKDIIAMSGKSEKVLWVHKTGNHNFGGVRCADLDGDGVDDAVAPSLDGYLHALRGKDGKPVWPAAKIGSGSRSVPALADVNGDGVVDVLVVGIRGRLHVVDGRTGSKLWESSSYGEGLGPPAIARMKGKVLILAPMGNAGLVAFDFEEKKELWRSMRPYAVLAGPVVADLDKDGLREVVVGTDSGSVLVLDLASGALLWEAEVGGNSRETDRPPTLNVIEGCPAVADLDGDGYLDILIADHHFELTALSGRGTIGARKRLKERRE